MTLTTHNTENHRQQAENAAKAVSEANSAISAALADLDNLEERLAYCLDDINAALDSRHAAAIEFHSAMKPLVDHADQVSVLVPKPPAFSKSTSHRTAEAAATIKRLRQQIKTLG